MIRSWFKSSKSSDPLTGYIVTVVTDLPDALNNNEILIVNEGGLPELLAFKCPCGCNADIFLNLLSDTSPRWKYYLSDKSMISITPSVWKKNGCKSHFFITNSVVRWV